MSINAAASSLRERVSNAPWLTAIGVGREKGREVIVVYVTSPPRAKTALPRGWHGYPVVIRKMGAIRPAYA